MGLFGKPALPLLLQRTGRFMDPLETITHQIPQKRAMAFLWAPDESVLTHSNPSPLEEEWWWLHYLDLETKRRVGDLLKNKSKN